MKQRVLVSSIIMGLYASLAVGNAMAQSAADKPSGTDDQKKGTTELQGVVVTGSLIPQAQIETASPVVTITADQMKRQGFGNVYEALRSQPLANGAVQDNQFQGGFTQGASTIRLLGLDAGFTLILVDGHPLADYPLLYNGSSNFVDLSNIPTGMVDHIDILPGNQSSIYGSSAIAGVINIILKQKVDGLNLNFRVGGFTQGGGANQRLEFIGGHSFGNSVDVTYGLQISNTNPVWGYQRDMTASTLAGPPGAAKYGARTFLYGYYNNAGKFTYDNSASNGCSGLTGLFNGTTDAEVRPGRGPFCGSKYETGYGTIKDASRQIAGYLHITDRINDNMELYGTLLYNANSQRYNDGARFWYTSYDTGGLFVNGNTGRLEEFQHIFAPEETGGLGTGQIRELQRAYNGYAGLRGSIGSSNWNYDAYVDRSEYFDDTKELWPLKNAVDSFMEKQFLGPKLGTTSGYPIYAPNVANFYKPLTKDQYLSFQGEISSKSKTWTQHVNLQVTNTDLLSLPAGSVGFGAIVQAGQQSWSNPAQPELINGDFWGRTGTQGAGKRDLYGAAAELRIPVFSMLTANLSGRYDKYTNDGGGGDSKATWKLGLEFRPLDSLLFRGNYATAFKAPDMSYVFGGKSGFFSSVTDYYRCAKVEPGTPLVDCTYNPSSFFDLHSGNKDLKSVTAKSYGGGIVWSPTADFNIKADYYDIKISNEVSLQSIDQLMRDESACRLGQIDITSPTCIAALAQVHRNAATAQVPYVLNEIDVYPINVSKEHLSGITASLTYRWDAGRYGDFIFGANYNVTLNHTQQQYPGDPNLNLLNEPYYSTDFRSIFSGSVSWNIGPWSTTVLGTRFGKTPNYVGWTQGAQLGYATPGAGTVAPWALYNGSVTYNFSDDASMAFIVNNIFDSGPPHDSSWVAAPYYNYNVFNVYGRQIWLEMNVHFK